MERFVWIKQRPMREAALAAPLAFSGDLKRTRSVEAGLCLFISVVVLLVVRVMYLGVGDLTIYNSSML